jgi:8-oxo-dGTP pyrophosphatase MutT (NUDIX family)
MYKIYAQIGFLLHKLSLPVIRLLIRRTNRAYLIIQKDDKVLLTNNWFGNNLWALPGGGIRSSETPEQALVREVEEELELKIDQKSLKLLDSGRWQTDQLNFKYLIYGTNQKIGPKFKQNKLELVDVGWVNIESLNTNNTSEEILKVLSKMA